MTMLYRLYNGVNLDFGVVIWQQRVQSLYSSSPHSVISCGKYWSIITKWAMDRLHVPIMADSLLLSIATFHTTKIIVTDPSKFFFIGSIPEAMYASKGQTPKKQKSDETAPSKPKQKKLKNPARRLILQSSSDSDSEYVPPGNKPPTPTESESERSDEEASDRGDTPPRSPTPEVPVRSPVPSSPPASIPISLPTTFPVITSEPTSTIPIPTPLFSQATKTTTTRDQTNVSDTGVRSSVQETTKPLSPTPSTETNTVLGIEDLEFDSFYYNPYRVQSDEDDDAPLTKKSCKELNSKLDTLMASSSSHNPNSKSAIQKMLDSFVKAHEASISRAIDAITASTKGAAELNASKVTNSITKLEEEFAAEKKIFVNLRQDIQKDNVALFSSLNERFTKLQDDLAMENSLMHELARKTTQLKTKNLQLSQANNEANQLRSKRDVVKSCDGTSETRGEGRTSLFQPPPTSQPEQQKTEHASGSGPKDKGKGPIVDDNDEEEETIADALKRKAREREIDLNDKIVKEAEERDDGF
ncbi:uncharacterized protein LOC111885730 [Lactuca sativa]|uniref:uncharacterized protein LOC111885730 n=1 Tax=Lactuca sativa TaxID=4236 RepID=UPI000CD877B3|nr:uncharacterized protein LOC111885730 [Lactuca sativa]